MLCLFCGEVECCPATLRAHNLPRWHQQAKNFPVVLAEVLGLGLTGPAWVTCSFWANPCGMDVPIGEALGVR